MKSLKIHGPEDLRIEDYPLENISPNQVEVSIAVGGICGTDLHYYKHGGFGQIKLKEPMILGHEVSGFISKIEYCFRLYFIFHASFFVAGSNLDAAGPQIR